LTEYDLDELYHKKSKKPAKQRRSGGSHKNGLFVLIVLFIVAAIWIGVYLAEPAILKVLWTDLQSIWHFLGL